MEDKQIDILITDAMKQMSSLINRLTTTTLDSNISMIDNKMKVISTYIQTLIDIKRNNR